MAEGPADAWWATKASLPEQIPSGNGDQPFRWPQLYQSASAPLLGPVQGPGSRTFPGRPPSFQQMCGADTQYSLPSTDVNKERVSFSFTMGAPLPGRDTETLGPGPASYDPTPVDVFKTRTGCAVKFAERFGKEPLKRSLTEDAFCRYEGDLMPPSDTGTKFGTQSMSCRDLKNTGCSPSAQC